MLSTGEWKGRGHAEEPGLNSGSEEKPLKSFQQDEKHMEFCLEQALWRGVSRNAHRQRKKF